MVKIVWLIDNLSRFQIYISTFLMNQTNIDKNDNTKRSVIALQLHQSSAAFDRTNYNHLIKQFTNEDYICPNVDHELMYKCLKDNNSDQKRHILITKHSPNRQVDLLDQIVDLNSNIKKQQLIHATSKTNPILPSTNTKSTNKREKCKDKTRKILNDRKVHQSIERTKDIDKVSELNTTSNSPAKSCEFYKRLISEIKTNIKNDKNQLTNSLWARPQSKSITTNVHDFLMKIERIKFNYSNSKAKKLNGIDEDNNNSIVFQRKNSSVIGSQIEHWLNEIMVDTVIEPMETVDIMALNKFNKQPRTIKK